MFSDLPKIFDRNFAIAYLLPVVLFMAASLGLLEIVDRVSEFKKSITVGNLFDLTVLIVIAWIGATMLLVLNREIIRFLEGYGAYNPFLVFRKKYIKKYNSIKNRWSDLTNRYYSLNKLERRERTKLKEKLVRTFPDDEDDILPTAFGNALRAFEVYSRVMYGIESIYGWPRLLAVIPKEYREQIDDAKAKVDWWVNLSVMSLLFLVEFWIVIFSTWRLTPGWLITAFNVLIPLGIFLVLNWLILRSATNAAIDWGEYVKSAFDVYRFDLLDALGIDHPKQRNEERETWINLSSSITFRSPDYLPSLKVTRKSIKKKNNPNA